MSAPEAPTLFTNLLNRFVPDAVRSLLGLAQPQETMVFDLENLPVAPSLTPQDIAARRQNGPYADMRE